MTVPDGVRGALPDGAPEGELELQGRILQASNATFVGSIAGTRVIYKPIAGERPLWDFPGATLAHREYASYLLSQASGWDVVPTTWLREGPLGHGMAQVWQQPDADQEAVTIVAADEQLEPGWCHVFDGLDELDQPVSLIHEDSPELRRMALFDVIVNNADRKGGHVLEMTGGHRYGVDHGLTFHDQHKLRTVLWGWQGKDLTAAEIAGLTRIHEALRGDLAEDLAGLISTDELRATRTRCDELLEHRHFPVPTGHGPAIPWPPF